MVVAEADVDSELFAVAEIVDVIGRTAADVVDLKIELDDSV